MLELMLVLVIIAILAGLAMPRFSQVYESTKAKEAVAALQQIRTGERIYRIEEEFYYPHYTVHPTAEDDESIMNSIFRIFLDTQETDWSYEVDTDKASEFDATATREGGPYDQQTITINEAGELGGTWELPLPEN